MRFLLLILDPMFLACLWSQQPGVCKSTFRLSFPPHGFCFRQPWFGFPSEAFLQLFKNFSMVPQPLPCICLCRVWSHDRVLCCGFFSLEPAHSCRVGTEVTVSYCLRLACHWCVDGYNCAVYSNMFWQPGKTGVRFNYWLIQPLLRFSCRPSPCTCLVQFRSRGQLLGQKL